jgi:hypothetical protein
MMQRVRLSIACAALLILQTVPAARTAACLIDPCLSSASSAGGVLLACPAGDGPTLSSIGATVTVTVLTCGDGQPIPLIPAEDFWIIQDVPLWSDLLCGGYRSSDADAPSDMNGQTTIRGTIAAGGYMPDAIYVVAQGYVIGLGCLPDVTLPLVVVSPDINGDLVVDLVDLSSFAFAFSGGGRAVDPRMDFNGDGQIDIVDLGLIGLHFSHRCG